MTEKECPICGGTMYQEDVLKGPTTHANEDEVWGKDWICEDCQYQEEIEEDL